MLSQKNVLQVLVSTKNAPYVTPGTAVTALADGEIGLFDADTNLSIASGDGYLALNNGGKIIKSNPVVGVDLADVKANVPAAAHEETITIAAPSEPTYFQIAVHILDKYTHEEEIKKGFYKSKAGDTADDIAAALGASLQAALDRSNDAAIVVDVTTATITITGGAKEYLVGRKQGGYTKFRVFLNYPDPALEGTVTVEGTDGIGTGQYVHTKEFFAFKNQDATSQNHFRGAFDYKYLSSPDASYNVLSTVNKQLVTDVAANAQPITTTVLLAFDANGAAPTV